MAEKQNGLSHRFNVRLVFFFFAAIAVVFAAVTLIDLYASGYSWDELHGSAVHARSFATTISRAYNVLTGMIITAIALSIPITANMYTPKLTEIFVRDRVNIAVFIFFICSAAHAAYVTLTSWDATGDMVGFWPRLSVYALVLEMQLGFAILPAYFYYASGFLNPTYIIQRVSQQIVDEFDFVDGKKRPVEEVQRAVHQKILHLGNVILRAVDRADRDVSLDAISALKRVVFKYTVAESRAAPGWFDVPPDLFIGLSSDAVRFINEERYWVEYKCMSQLTLAFNAALAKIPDAISAITDVARELGLHFDRHGDRRALELTIRFINAFLREAVKRKDVHAIYDVMYQYRLLARDIMARHPDLVLQMGRYFKYYGEFAKLQGLPFIYELTAYEIGTIVEWAYEADAAPRRDLLQIFLTFDGAHSSVRLVKARAMLGAYFIERGFDREASLIRESLAPVAPALLAAAKNDILGTIEPKFWEVTDRQVNLDFVPDERKPSVYKMFELAAAPPPTVSVGVAPAPTTRVPAAVPGATLAAGAATGGAGAKGNVADSTDRIKVVPDEDDMGERTVIAPANSLSGTTMRVKIQPPQPPPATRKK